MNKDKDIVADDIFSGRGAPAFMSEKEPAIKLLKRKYSESFALTEGARENQVHLFLIKLGMWALVYTFTWKDLDQSGETSIKTVTVENVLNTIERAMLGEKEILSKKLDEAVNRSLERIQKKVDELKPRR